MSKTIEECTKLWTAACELQACAALDSPGRLREAFVKKVRIADLIVPLMADSARFDALFEEMVRPELDVLWTSLQS